MLVTGPTTGAYEKTVEELRVDYKNVKIAQKGDLVSIKVDERIRRNDKLFKWKDARLVNDSQD